jgi:hypothetical protein
MMAALRNFIVFTEDLDAFSARFTSQLYNVDVED